MSAFSSDELTKPERADNRRATVTVRVDAKHVVVRPSDLLRTFRKLKLWCVPHGGDAYLLYGRARRLVGAVRVQSRAGAVDLLLTTSPRLKNGLWNSDLVRGLSSYANMFVGQRRATTTRSE